MSQLTLPRIVQNNMDYPKSYVNSLLNNKQGTIDPPDLSKANGSSEMLEGFHATHEQLGPEELLIQIRRTLDTPGLPRYREWLQSFIEAPLKRLLHEDELDNLPKSKWLIDDEIPENSLVILYGKSGVGKSFVTLDYAKRISKDVPVIYVAAEGGWGYLDRKDAWNLHHKSGSAQLYFYFEAPNLLDSSEVELFIKEVESNKPKLIIFDTLARCMIGDENSARDIGIMVRNCNLIMIQLNTTVMLVHHTGKQRNDERGSSALRGAADLMMELSSNNNMLTLKCSKSKNTAGFKTKQLTLISVDLGNGRTSLVVVNTDMPITQNKTIMQDKTTTQDPEISQSESAIVMWLSSTEQLFNHGESATNLETVTGIPHKSFFNAIKELKHKDLIKKDKKRDPYVLTEKGKFLAEANGWKKY